MAAPKGFRYVRAMTLPLTVVCGNACTGKTTWAKSLAKALGAMLLDIDTASERLVEAAQLELGRDPKDRDSSAYKQAYRDAIHETLFALARDNEHAPLVLVAPFTLERAKSSFVEWLRSKVGRDVTVHYFVTCDPVRYSRILARGFPRDRLKVQDFATYAAVGREESPPAYPHEWFDTTDSFPDVSQFLANRVA